MTTYRKLVTFDTAEREAIRWLVSHGFGINDQDAIRKAVTRTRASMETVA